MPVECPLCDDSHTITSNDGPVCCPLCDSGGRQLDGVRLFSNHPHVRCWLVTTVQGEMWMAVDAEIAGDYRFYAIAQLPVERMTTDEDMDRVFTQVATEFGDRFYRDILRAKARAAGQSVH